MQAIIFTNDFIEWFVMPNIMMCVYIIDAASRMPFADGPTALGSMVAAQLGKPGKMIF